MLSSPFGAPKKRISQWAKADLMHPVSMIRCSFSNTKFWSDIALGGLLLQILLFDLFKLPMPGSLKHMGKPYLSFLWRSLGYLQKDKPDLLFHSNHDELVLRRSTSLPILSMCVIFTLPHYRIFYALTCVWNTLKGVLSLGTLKITVTFVDKS